MKSKKSASAKSSSRKIRYAVVGLGHIAQEAVLPAFARTGNSELAALVSGDDAKLEQLKKKYGLEKSYTYEQFEQCLADEAIDAVYIALPNDLHCDCALHAANAGKHILCEKPLALNESEGRLMTGLAEQNDVKLMTAYRLHFEPTTLATIELIRSGKIGEPRYFNASFSYQLTDEDNIRTSHERGGGPIYDIGTYCINAARLFLGDEPVEVSAFLDGTGDRRFREVEESAAVVLRFPGGKVASFVVSFGAATSGRCELVGTKGSIVLDPAFEYSESLKQKIIINDKPQEKEFPHTDQFAGEIEAFSDCILRNEDPEPNGWEGIADLRVIDAIFESAETARAVRLEPFEKPQRPARRQEKRKPAPERETDLVHVESPHD